MTELNQDELNLLLERLREVDQFTEEEREALRVLIKAYRGWAAMGWFFKWFVYTMAALAGLITAGRTILEWLKAVV